MEGEPSQTRRLTGIHLQKTSDEYTVGWICAICTEYIAAQATLDEEHERPSYVAPADQNEYTFGPIGNHNVVIAVLPNGDYGVESAAIVARDMTHSFANIKVGLMVGIGGGAPSERHDIRLGDIVVSVPRDGQSGVLQYGFGKMIQGQPFQATRLLNQSPRILRAAVNGVQSQYRRKGYRQLREIIDGILERNPTLQKDFGRPDLNSDRLYRSEIIRPEDNILDCSIACGDDPSKLIVRPRRIADEGAPAVHYGLIASSNTLMKDATIRDKYALEQNVMCFEMEAAGLMNQFPCLVVRGISDYSDTHKNDQWQGYAAMAAAAYAKDLLYRIALDNTNIPQRVAREEKAQISSDSQEQAIFKSLKFDQYNKRFNCIKAAYAGTCKWLQESAEYNIWLDPNKITDHHGFLWIRGNPGAGKSTIMKYALITARETMRDRILLSFFFNARGGDLEKSTLGMYRSLLLQLLQQLPGLQDALDLSKFTTYHDEGYQWHIESLKSLFHQALESIQTSKVVCFIDALDECDEDQARDMILFFEYLVHVATSKGISFLVCFSKRHYPSIVIKKGLDIVLECQKPHDQDIFTNVRSELKIGQSNIANHISADIPRKSCGIFMWAILVVLILNKEYDEGRIYNLQTKYLEIPRGLHELFKNVFTRNSDRKSTETLRCLQWLLFSRELLRPEQLYFAVLSDVLPRLLPSQISRQDMLRFTTNSSMGLARFIMFFHPETCIEKVRFIHYSVKDFLLKEGGLRHIWPDLGDNIHGRSHEQLKQCCLKWIGTGDVVYSRLVMNRPGIRMGEIQEEANKKFPFLGYAVGNVLYHANAAQKYGISQVEFLKEFKSDAWMILRRIFEVWEYPSNTRLLYALAELNMSYLISCHPSKIAFSEVGDECFGTPLFAALANGSNEAIIEFLKAQAEITPEFHNLYEEYYRKSLDLSHFRPGFTFSRFKNILSHFTHPDEGNKILQVAFLLNIQHPHLNLDWKDDCSQAPLLYVYGKGDKALLSVLISKFVNDINEIDHFSNALLQTAVKKGHKDFVELLLQKGANIETYDWNDNNTPLGVAAAKGYVDIVIQLIKSNAKIEARNRLNQTPLMLAVINDHKDVAIQLIRAGAKTEARDRCDHTPLMVAVTKGFRDMVILLLENGCNSEVRGDDGMTPLLLAMENRRTDVVIQLIEKGCNFEAKDEGGMTPLMYAVTYYHKDLVNLLLRKGANIEAMSKRGWTPLISAMTGGYEDVAIQLLEKGANIEAMDKDGQTPLMWAIRKRNPGLVKLLLGRGAKVTTEKVANIRPRLYEFPQQLQEKIRANSELTLLEFAQQFEETEVIELLSRNGAT
ncbi:hypothetical protein GGI43DRAFT_364600 [Trichoderma evansii]